MPIVTAACSFCGHSYTGKDAMKLARSCEAQHNPPHRFSVGQKIENFVITELRFKNSNGVHQPAYKIKFFDWRRSAIWLERKIVPMYLQDQMRLDTLPEYTAPQYISDEEEYFSTKKNISAVACLELLSEYGNVAVKDGSGRVLALCLIGELVYGVLSNGGDSKCSFFLIKRDYLCLIYHANNAISCMAIILCYVISESDDDTALTIQRVMLVRQNLSYKDSADLLGWDFLDSSFEDL